MLAAASGGRDYWRAATLAAALSGWPVVGRSGGQSCRREERVDEVGVVGGGLD